MRTPLLTTRISLPPGLLSSQVVREFLRLSLEEFRWFEPRRYGYASLKEKVDPERIDHDALTSYYEENGILFVAARTNRDFFMILPTRHDVPPYDPPHRGGITWVTSAKSAAKDSWRTTHVEQVTRLMRLVGSPYAVTALDEDYEGKKQRRVDMGTFHQQVPTVRGYDEGLAGLFWRNFFGPPFVRLFGERLSSLPPESLQTLDEELVLVQPYELPTLAGTDEGLSRERSLTQLLGPECFYDHERHTPPSRRPVLEHLSQPLH
jgi:hypothetical protein